MMRAMMRRLTGGRRPEIRPGESLSCAEVGRLVQRYLDGELERESEVDALAAHLEACRRCGLEAETYRRIKDGLAAHSPEVPAESIARLRAFGQSLTD